MTAKKSWAIRRKASDRARREPSPKGLGPSGLVPCPNSRNSHRSNGRHVVPSRRWAPWGEGDGYRHHLAALRLAHCVRWSVLACRQQVALAARHPHRAAGFDSPFSVNSSVFLQKSAPGSSWLRPVFIKLAGSLYKPSGAHPRRPWCRHLTADRTHRKRGSKREPAAR